jgi:prenyltransferase beta subunit
MQGTGTILLWQSHIHVCVQPVCNLCAQVLTCYHPEDGGFGASPRNDSHMLATLSALQILALLDELHRVDADRVVACE